MEENKVFKVVLVGDGGVGKSTLVKRLLTGDFEKDYVATLGVEVHPIKFNTNHGKIKLNIWDCAGQEKFGGLRDGYYIQANAAIFMFDLTSKVTFNNLPKWINGVKKVCGDIPFAVCGSKNDVDVRKVSAATISEIPKCFEISTKTCDNIYTPFIELMKHLTGHDDLVMIDEE